MMLLPPAVLKVLTPFACLFTQPTWNKVLVLLVGAILTPRKRTITAALRVVGLANRPGFAKYHQVLNRAAWSSLKASRILLGLLLATFDCDRPLVFGIDETLERRWGAKIKAKGIYRDSVRSSHSHFVKCSGLRWITLMLLTPIPWAQRVWALPVLTALAPSTRYCEQQGLRYKKLTDWARQILLLLRRWLPDRNIVVVADNGYSVLELLHACQCLINPITMITRLRFDAALYEPAPPRRKGQVGRPRCKGKRLPTLAAVLTDPRTAWCRTETTWYDDQKRCVEFTSGTAVWFHNGKAPVPIRWLLIRDPRGELDPQALLCTDPEVDALQIVGYFVLRWRLEVTFEEVRAHLGVETQRQWSDLAITRTTPVLLGLFSWVTLAAHELQARDGAFPVQAAAWYRKRLPTFSDALALLRSRLWQGSEVFGRSSSSREVIKIPRPLFDGMLNTLCYTA
jgi:hypothetical protein